MDSTGGKQEKYGGGGGGEERKKRSTHKGMRGKQGSERARKGEERKNTLVARSGVVFPARRKFDSSVSRVLSYYVFDLFIEKINSTHFPLLTYFITGIGPVINRPWGRARALTRVAQYAACFGEAMNNG